MKTQLEIAMERAAMHFMDTEREVIYEDADTVTIKTKFAIMRMRKKSRGVVAISKEVRGKEVA